MDVRRGPADAEAEGGAGSDAEQHGTDGGDVTPRGRRAEAAAAAAAASAAAKLAAAKSVEGEGGEVVAEDRAGGAADEMETS